MRGRNERATGTEKTLCLRPGEEYQMPGKVRPEMPDRVLLHDGSPTIYKRESADRDRICTRRDEEADGAEGRQKMKMKLPSGYVFKMKYKVKNAITIEAEVEKTELITCKDCKYFELDSFKRVDGTPIIVANEICQKWGDGCKTREDGWCFLAKKREEEIC